MSASGPSAAVPGAPHPLLGIALIVGASAFFALLDAVIKILAERYSPVMLSWTRYFFHLAVMLLVFGRSRGLGLIRTRRPLAQIGRGAGLALSALSFFTAVSLLPQAEATAILSIAPMLVTAGAVWLLNERAPRGTAWALALSFVGVLLILRPGGGMDSWGALLSLAAAFFSASYALLTRAVARTDDSLATLFLGALVAFGCLTLVVPFFWQWPLDVKDLLLMVGTGTFGALCHLLLVRAYTVASASTLAPFSYAHAACSLITGLLFFGAFPDAVSLSGMALIVATGVAMALKRRAAG
ncbi:MAG: DMT family transporter [Betaproteobacteria bacterium]